jgi:ubiquitin related modifier 1
MFDNLKQISVDLPESANTMEGLIDHLRRNHLKDKEEMFVQGTSVRPGIIVLVNDTDWELLDTTKYKIEERDNVAFISTLHGG